MGNFIDDYIALIRNFTDASDDYHEACALFLLSTFVGRRFVFQSMPDSNPWSDEDFSGGKFLNLWFMLIGKSRVARKTTVIKYVKHMIRLIDDKLLLPFGFTPEALMQSMTEICKGSVSGDETHCVWIKDEVLSFFKPLKKADGYMAGVDSTLSEIYDCEDTMRATMKWGSQMIKKPYLTSLLAGTESVPAIFDDEMIMQGFLNRFMFVIPESKNPFVDETTLRTEAQKEAGRDLRDFLKTLHTEVNETIIINLRASTKKKYDEFVTKIEKGMENTVFGIKEGYYGNLPTFVLKLACLYRISKLSLPEIAILPRMRILVVDPDDFDRAEIFTLKVWKWFEKMVELMMTTSKGKDLRDDSREITLVYSKIKLLCGAIGGRVEYSELSRNLNLTANRLNPIIVTLIDQSRIELKTESVGKGKSKRWVVWLK